MTFLIDAMLPLSLKAVPAEAHCDSIHTLDWHISNKELIGCFQEYLPMIIAAFETASFVDLARGLVIVHG